MGDDRLAEALALVKQWKEAWDAERAWVVSMRRDALAESKIATLVANNLREMAKAIREMAGPPAKSFIDPWKTAEMLEQQADVLRSGDASGTRDV